MKKVIWLSLIVILCATSGSLAQIPAPDPDTVPPVKEGDPAIRQLPPRMDYSDDKKRITPEELPDPVKQTLESSAQYTGWEKAEIFQDKKKEEFIIEFDEKGKTTAYRFNKDGTPIVKEE